jgi:hypothetical protein
VVDDPATSVPGPATLETSLGTPFGTPPSAPGSPDPGSTGPSGTSPSGTAPSGTTPSDTSVTSAGTSGTASSDVPADAPPVRTTPRFVWSLTAALQPVLSAPLRARDLGVPSALLVLLGAHLAAGRWFGRGVLPMLSADGRGDDVHTVL